MRKNKTYNLNVMEAKNALSYYLLGVFMTDGCVKVKPNNRGYESQITSKDKDWLESINKILSPDNLIYSVDNYYTLRITNKDFTMWLIANQCTPRKSLTLKMPEIPQEYFRDFLRGCIDGDGCITFSPYNKTKKSKTYTYTKYKAYLCSGSFEFINDIEKYLKYFNFKYSISEITKEKQKPGIVKDKQIIAKNSIYRIYFNDSSCIELLQFLYYQKDLLCLQRKQILSNAMIESYQSR